MRNPNSRIPDPNEFVSNPGEVDRVVYTSKVLEDGSVLLTPCGKENIKEIINSYVDQTDIHYIIQQLSMGNVSVLNNKQPMYGDFTEAPKDMRQAMQIMMDGEKAFYQLDLDTRQKFDNDFRKFIVSAGSPDWLKKLGYYEMSEGQTTNSDQKEGVENEP